MYFCRLTTVLFAWLLASTASAGDYVLGAGVDGDSADNLAVALFGDFGVGEKTWISLAAATAETKGLRQDILARSFDAEIDYWLRPLGFRVGGGYWGDPDILDSRDLEATVYLRGDPGSLSVVAERRNFEFVLQSDALRGRVARFSADGLGVNGRIALGERFELHAGAMAYDYSRNMRIEPDIDVLAFISASRLSMINSLVDSRVNAGVEYRFGLRSIDLAASRWEAAIDGSIVESLSVGYLTPLGDRTDIEIRLAVDDSDTFGRTTAVSFYLYYFGGSQAAQ